MKTVALIQARMNSTRLPGKVLKTIVGKPMLELMLERVQISDRIDEIWVVTSNQEDDDPIYLECQRLNVPCYRGSKDNVLNRYYEAAIHSEADVIVRLTGDCPLVDPEIIDNTIDFFFSENADYSANCLEYTLPDGLDVEVFSLKVLNDMEHASTKKSEQEHVTLYIRNHPEKYKIKNWYYPDPFEGRWTVDYPEDFKLIEAVFSALYKKFRIFTTKQVRSYLESNEQLVKVNNMYKANEGLAISLLEDK